MTNKLMLYRCNRQNLYPEYLYMVRYTEYCTVLIITSNRTKQKVQYSMVDIVNLQRNTFR